MTEILTSLYIRDIIRIVKYLLKHTWVSKLKESKNGKYKDIVALSRGVVGKGVTFYND